MASYTRLEQPDLRKKGQFSQKKEWLALVINGEILG